MAKRTTQETIKKIHELTEKGLQLNEIKEQVDCGYGAIQKYTTQYWQDKMIKKQLMELEVIDPIILTKKASE